MTALAGIASTREVINETPVSIFGLLSRVFGSTTTLCNLVPDITDVSILPGALTAARAVLRFITTLKGSRDRIGAYRKCTRSKFGINWFPTMVNLIRSI